MEVFILLIHKPDKVYEQQTKFQSFLFSVFLNKTQFLFPFAKYLYPSRHNSLSNSYSLLVFFLFILLLLPMVPLSLSFSSIPCLTPHLSMIAELYTSLRNSLSNSYTVCFASFHLFFFTPVLCSNTSIPYVYLYI